MGVCIFYASIFTWMHTGQLPRVFYWNHFDDSKKSNSLIWHYFKRTVRAHTFQVLRILTKRTYYSLLNMHASRLFPQFWITGISQDAPMTCSDWPMNSRISVNFLNKTLLKIWKTCSMKAYKYAPYPQLHIPVRYLQM